MDIKMIRPYTEEEKEILRRRRLEESKKRITGEK